MNFPTNFNDWFSRPRYSRSLQSYNAFPTLAIFGTGMVVGCSLALMFAPKSGRELRRDVARRVNEIGQSARESLPISDRSTDRPVTDRTPEAMGAA